jgi:hypothetical protein
MVAAAILDFALKADRHPMVILLREKYSGFEYDDSSSTGSKVTAVFEIFNLAGISVSEGFVVVVRAYHSQMLS